ncbi:BRD4-interacting chromatin-remodeling complex-associated protein-like [Armigeres subalbatus]|uniref:BRD4-interacting chromatin-remodeling complex-associated protein-like n=1 Tax=Armigeres subalbatus TaxID=124917 RepID=UPI002ECFB68E
MKRLQSRQIVFFVLLLLAVTMPVLVPGQQYTGVKSVSPASSSDNTEEVVKSSEQKGGGTSSGISARSIDKFEANELPDGDSKIIKLDIKQVEPKVTSGSRGARNLGFSADVSLNSIPGGLNNELTSGDFKIPVTPPSAVAKDSYGNPVTPFADVGTTGLDAAGFVQDFNRDTLQGSNNNQYSHLDFKLPSYASGIIQPVQLPSLSPSSFHSQNDQNQFARQPTTTNRIPTTTPFQFVPNAKIPTIGDGQILFAQKPLNGLIPPIFPGEELPVYKVEVGTERSPIFARDPFGSPTLDKGLTLPHATPPVNFNQGSPQNPQVPLQVPLSLAPLPPQQTQTPQQHQFPPSSQSHQVHQQPQFKPTQAPVQKFTGSFGGAPGFLGSQQNLGTAYTSTPKPAQSTAPQSYPTPPPTHVLPSIQQTSTPTKPPNKFTGSFGGAPGFLGNQQNLGTAYTSTPKPAQPIIPQTPPPAQTTHFAPPVHQAAHPTQPPNKFTGSFGGAPGFLGNQQNLGTAYKPTTSNPSTPQRPVSFQPAPPQPTFQQPQQFPQTQAPSIIRPPSPFQPSTQHQQQQPHRPGQFTGNKFSGSFGGAPGLLGNQQKPGTHVKPDGTILPPSGPGLAGSNFTPSTTITTGNVIHRPSVASSGSTFTGSFGGPPGVLRPFDNVKG